MINFTSKKWLKNEGGILKYVFLTDKLHLFSKQLFKIIGIVEFLGSEKVKAK